MDATIDDGSCDFTSCGGCTDATACNYDDAATLDDGSCDYSCVGCTDSMACNYDMDATVDSGDCTYPAADYLDCDGNRLNDEDGDGLCDEEEGCGDPMACNYDAGAAVEEADYCLIVDTFMVHTAGNLAGMTTYRYYVKCANPADFVSAVSGDLNNPTIVNTTTDFYQDELGGTTPNGIISFLFGQFPDVQYDSWVTIGLSEAPNTAIGEAAISTVQGTANPWATNFDPGFGTPGGNIVIDDAVGGAWYALNGDNNGIAANHPDQQVLIAQLTTSGDVEGNFYVQIFENGDGQDGEISSTSTLEKRVSHRMTIACTWRMSTEWITSIATATASTMPMATTCATRMRFPVAQMRRPSTMTRRPRTMMACVSTRQRVCSTSLRTAKCTRSWKPSLWPQTSTAR